MKFSGTAYNSTGNDSIDEILVALLYGGHPENVQKAADKAAGVLNAALEFPVRHASANQ